MSERTVIVTMEITKIYKNVGKHTSLSKKSTGKRFAEKAKKMFDADDVVVTNVQEFVLEDEE